MKLITVRVTLRQGVEMVGTLEKFHKDIYWVKVGNDVYKFYKGAQQIEIIGATTENEKWDIDIIKNDGKEALTFVTDNKTGRVIKVESEYITCGDSSWWGTESKKNLPQYVRMGISRLLTI